MGVARIPGRCVAEMMTNRCRQNVKLPNQSLPIAKQGCQTGLQLPSRGAALGVAVEFVVQRFEADA